MITAYCDHCGAKIDPEYPAGCRLLVGKREWTFHLCADHHDALEILVGNFVGEGWRRVK